jgi:hypothetical protein
MDLPSRGATVLSKAVLNFQGDIPNEQTTECIADQALLKKTIWQSRNDKKREKAGQNALIKPV